MTLPAKQKQKKSMRIRRVTSSTPFLTLVMRGHTSFLMSRSGTNKFISILNQMSVELHSKFSGFLRVKTRLLKRLQAVEAAISAIQSQKDSVEADVGSSSAKIHDIACCAVGWQPLAGS